MDRNRLTVKHQGVLNKLFLKIMVTFCNYILQQPTMIFCLFYFCLFHSLDIFLDLLFWRCCPTHAFSFLKLIEMNNVLFPNFQSFVPISQQFIKLLIQLLISLEGLSYKESTVLYYIALHSIILHCSALHGIRFYTMPQKILPIRIKEDRCILNGIISNLTILHYMYAALILLATVFGKAMYIPRKHK